jgi:hypothetical protein
MCIDHDDDVWAVWDMMDDLFEPAPPPPPPPRPSPPPDFSLRQPINPYMLLVYAVGCLNAFIVLWCTTSTYSYLLHV